MFVVEEPGYLCGGTLKAAEDRDVTCPKTPAALRGRNDGEGRPSRRINGEQLGEKREGTKLVKQKIKQGMAAERGF